MDIKRIKTLDIDNLVNSIISNHYDKDYFTTKIDKSNLPEEDRKAMLTKINMAYKRFDEPLELSLRAFYLFAPFGLVNVFLNSKDVNFERFQKYKYLKKIKQRYIFSIIGMVTYLLIGIISGLISRYYY